MLRQLSLVLLACAGVAGASGDAGIRRLLQTTFPVRAGPFTDWIVPECAAPCPNLFLASWGIQCGLGADQCCLRKDTLCVKTAPYAAELKPASWTGRNLTSTATGGSTNSTAPAPPKACTGGGKWFNASATQYWSYPPCCTDPTVDQTECVVYSGCKYEGLFAAFGDNKKSLDWVKAHNIAALYQSGKSYKAWKKNFMNKKIKVRNPITCQVITVTSYDTCDGAACPDPSGVGPGCCTAHADMNGGTLVDLEYFTSVRFWGAPIGVDEVRRLEWQFA